jgi:hypothetical protein
VASILLSVQEFQTTGYPETVPVSTFEGWVSNVIQGQDTITKQREKGENIKFIHIRYKSNTVLHHKKFQKCKQF